MGRKVGSLREALVLAGSRRVQNWVALLLARPTSGGAARDRFTSTLIRARACELLATRVSPALASLGFAAGMLSAVDILLHVSPDEARAALPHEV
jgi:EAL and modified HD-GYP domain-containing signal transduction protein